MGAVELHLADELLDDFEAIRPKLNGHETSRRPSTTCDGCTIFEMEMADAPAQAQTMEVVVSVTDGQLEVGEIHYWDVHGIFLAPVVPFRKAVD
jgi:hypothetical protein